MTKTKADRFDTLGGDQMRDLLADPHNDDSELAFELVDAIAEALERAGDLTHSKAARMAKCDTSAARIALGYLVDHQYAHTSGNGAWVHYHPGRGR